MFQSVYLFAGCHWLNKEGFFPERLEFLGCIYNSAISDGQVKSALSDSLVMRIGIDSLSSLVFLSFVYFVFDFTNSLSSGKLFFQLSRFTFYLVNLLIFWLQSWTVQSNLFPLYSILMLGGLRNETYLLFLMNFTMSATTSDYLGSIVVGFEERWVSSVLVGGRNKCVLLPIHHSGYFDVIILRAH